jgi:hypothetical protein
VRLRLPDAQKIGAPFLSLGDIIERDVAEEGPIRFPHGGEEMDGAAAGGHNRPDDQNVVSGICDPLGDQAKNEIVVAVAVVAVVVFVLGHVGHDFHSSLVVRHISAIRSSSRRRRASTFSASGIRCRP